MKRLSQLASVAALIAGSLWAVSQGASAATVEITNEVFTGNAPLTFTPTPDPSENFSGSVTGSDPATVQPPDWLLPGGPPRVRLSPFAFNIGPGPGGSAAVMDASYNVLGVGGSATYNVNSSSFTLLWGSPDPWNQVEFFDGMGTPEGISIEGVIKNEITGADLTCFSTSCNGTGFDLVTFTAAGGDIGSVVLSNTTNPAFEFGIGVVPLPPAIYLFGSVLGGAFWLGRRKRSAVSGLGSA